jgi:hypothetical protein
MSQFLLLLACFFFLSLYSNHTERILIDHILIFDILQVFAKPRISMKPIISKPPWLKHCWSGTTRKRPRVDLVDEDDRDIPESESIGRVVDTEEMRDRERTGFPGIHQRSSSARNEAVQNPGTPPGASFV